MLHTESPETRERMSTHGLLHVLFLAGGTGLAARLAAHWTKLLANGRLEVDAVDRDGMNSTVSDCAPAGLAVVIHAPGCPGPIVAHHCGGRVDWHLTVDANEATAELYAQLYLHATRLLGDIGISRVHSALAMRLWPHPPMVIDGPDRARLLAA